MKIYSILVLSLVLSACGGGAGNSANSDSEAQDSVLTAQELVTAKHAQLNIGFTLGSSATAVYTALDLPTDLGDGVVSVWSSDNTSVINDSGVVARPDWGQADEVVNLEAVVSLAGEFLTKQFRVIVKAKNSVHQTGYEPVGWPVRGAERSFTKVQVAQDVQYAPMYTITDDVTGLVWEDTSAQYSYTDGREFIANNLAEASSRCNNLDFGGISDWRLPTTTELRTIISHDLDDYISSYDASYNRGEVAQSEFIFVDRSTPYWTNTERADITSPYLANWVIYFSSGLDVNFKYHTQYSGISGARVRCVAGPELPAPDFIRDASMEVVLDRTTGLMWQDNQIIEVDYDYDPVSGGLERYCAQLDLGGYTDWKVPNLNELKSIVDYEQVKPSTSRVFENVPANANGQFGSYWSITPLMDTGTVSTNTNSVWVVDFNIGYISQNLKSGTNYVRCVRQEG